MEPISGCEHNEVMKTVKDFMLNDDKENMLKAIGRIIEANVRSGFAEEYQMSSELGVLFDVKTFITRLSF